MGTRQLQLFSTAELAVMRDRTASRAYSPERDEFRREHERHRAWGLKRRHAERLRRLRGAAEEPLCRSRPQKPRPVEHGDGAQVRAGQAPRERRVSASDRTDEVAARRADSPSEPWRTRPFSAVDPSCGGAPATLVIEDALHAPTDRCECCRQ